MPKRIKRPGGTGEQPTLFTALLEAGVTDDIIARAVLEGERKGRDLTDLLHPVGHAGQRAQAEGIRSLRLWLPPPWVPENVNGQSRATNFEKGLSLVVMSGDRRTGLDGYPYPRAKHGKGEVTERSILANEQQLAFREFETVYHNPALIDGIQVWVLLVCRVHGGVGQPDLVRFEVSLPTKFENGNVRDWAHRRTYEPIILDTPPSMDNPPPDSTDESIDIPIKRRS